MSKRRRDGLLQDAGLTGSSSVSGLALKADMHLTWVSLRKLRGSKIARNPNPRLHRRAEMEAELPFHFISEKCRCAISLDMSYYVPWWQFQI